MTDIVAILKGIPSSFWGVIAGSFFSMVGVFLANRHNMKRLVLQFSHERSLRRYDKDRSMYQEVYLGAAEEIAVQLSAIMRFSDMKIPDQEILNHPNYRGGQIAKAQVIADEQARMRLAALGVELASAYIRLALKRGPLHLQKGRVEFLSKQIEGFLAKQESFNELMLQYNIEGKADQRKFDVIKGNFDFVSGALKTAMEERDAANAEYHTNLIKLVEECFEESVSLVDLVVPTIVELRRALELPTDEDELARVMRENIAKQRQALGVFSAQMKVFIEEK